MYVFSHLHKAAGTTVNHVLRRTFGLRHLDAAPETGRLYTKENLLSDSRRYFNPVSISGHGLRPHIDYGEFEREMEWFTIVRDPLSRCISHYQHQVQKMNNKTSFLEWIKTDHYRNWMVYFYGGGDSLQQALDSIHKKKLRVFDLSLGLENGMQQLFSGKLRWKNAVKNPARNSNVSNQIRSDKNMMEELHKANELDLQLYQHMKQMKLKPLSESSLPRFSSPEINYMMSFLFRNLFYRRNKMAISTPIKRMRQ